MENNNYTPDQFDALLFGHLSAEERNELKQQIGQDSQLSEAFRQNTAEVRAMQLLHEDALREQMNAWKAERTEEAAPAAAPKVSFLSTRLFQFAAAACGLLLVGYFAWRGTQPAFDGAQFAANNYPKSLNETIVRSADRGATDPLSDPFSMAIKSLEQADYATALVLLDQVKSEHKQYGEVQLLKGDCLYHLGKPEQALAIFTAYQQSAPTQDLREMAEWRSLLLLLSTKQQDSAAFKTLLERVAANPDHLFKKEIETLKGL